jgi:hypothetical protein
MSLTLTDIFEDGRYTPSTKIEKFVDQLNIDEGSKSALVEALEGTMQQAVERDREQREESEGGQTLGDSLPERALEILTDRSKNWINSDDSDILALLKMMRKTDFFEELNASKRFLRSIEENVEQIVHEYRELESEDA